MLVQKFIVISLAFISIGLIGCSSPKQNKVSQQQIEATRTAHEAEQRRASEKQLEIWRAEYRASFKHASTLSSLNRFIEMYQDHDEDGVMPVVISKRDGLEKNKKIYDDAIAKLPSDTQYLARYTPKNPLDYCSGYRKGSLDFETCSSLVGPAAKRLSRERAAFEKNVDVCKSVSTTVLGHPQAQRCQQFAKSSVCNFDESAGAPKLCAILQMKGF